MKSPLSDNEVSEREKIELVPIPEPPGTFLIAQKDYPPIMTPNGAFYHYSQVVVLLELYFDHKLNSKKV